MSYMFSGNGNTHRLLGGQVSGERSNTVSQSRKVSYFKAIRESHHSSARPLAGGSLLEALQYQIKTINEHGASGPGITIPLKKSAMMHQETSQEPSQKLQ